MSSYRASCSMAHARFVASLFLVASAAGEVRAGPPETPTNIRCWGTSDTRYVVRWHDNATDETEYRIERKTTGDWQQIGTEAGTADTGWMRHIDDGTNPAESYLYRVQAYRSTDDTSSAYSDICGSPEWLEVDNFRVFYNTSNCPACNGAVDGGDNCVASVLIALSFAQILEGALAKYRNLGFLDPPAITGMDALWPVNLKWSPNSYGVWNKYGIGLSPYWVTPLYDYEANSGEVRNLTTTLHELFHGVQRAYYPALYEADPYHWWVTEGQARGLQDLLCVPVPPDPCVNADDDPANSYYNEVNYYVGHPNRTLVDMAYNAAPFWNYLCGQYGFNAGEPEVGISFLVEFWNAAEAHPDQDGIGVIDAALDNLGSEDGFEEAFQKFVVRNYAKDLTGPAVPVEYQCPDDAQNTVPYDSVYLSLDQALGPDDQVGPVLTDVRRWGARYYEVQPAATVPSINVDFQVDSPHPAFFALLAVKNDDLEWEESEVALEFVRSLENDAYDKVAVIVAGLDHNVNFRYGINVVDPVLRILDPLEVRPALVGDETQPEKFILRLEVLSQTADPVMGIGPEEFTITVGAAVVPPEDVLAPAYVQGQYWFVIQAPQQSTDGLHDLTVEWSGLSDTELDAVDYTPRFDADNVLIIDRSGSMNEPPSKITDAKAAAKLYVDSWRTGDQIGVVSFSCSVSDPVDLTLRDWDDTSRDLALDRIDDIAADGGTSIGRGLLAGLGELVDEGAADHTWALILLSDGLNTCYDNIDTFLAEYDAREAASLKIPEVHTVAIGPDANRPDLEDLSNKTGGIYRFASEPADGDSLEVATTDFRRDIVDIFREVSERVAGQSRVLSVRGTATSDLTSIHHFTVDAGATYLVVAVSWNVSRPQTYVQDPSGATHALFKETPQHRVYRVGSPIAGEWEIGIDTRDRFSDYLAVAAVRSVLTMYLYLGLAVEDRIVGTPMPILVSLTDRAPVPDAMVKAAIEYPSGNKVSLELFDDGDHGDGKAGDGVYGNTLYATTEAGNHKVLAAATGTSPVVGDFVRQQSESFYMRVDRNSDRDCMPDGYEKRVGLDPNLDDGRLDSDGDGLDNCLEFSSGTHPLDADTDDGGETDGSEVQNRRDPLEPGDDRVKPPRVHAYPGVGEVLVRFNPPPGVLSFDIYRASGARDGTFELHEQSYPATAPFAYIDRRVQNDTLYRYKLVSIGAGRERSAPCDACEAIPRADPYPPHGWLSINDGARTTDSREVRLALTASDDHDPDEPRPGGFDPRAETSGVSEMRISNSSRFEGAVWERYASSGTWALDPNSWGMATVHVQYRDRAGNESDAYHASIRIGDAPQERFTRGDCNDDGDVDLSDPVTTLSFLFLGGPEPQCDDACDSNDDAAVDISDAITTLGALFLGQGTIPFPGAEDCGVDPTGDELSCETYEHCR